MELPGERDSARNNARCTQARKITHGLDGQHQDVDRTPRGRVSQNERTEIMEKVRPWCGQPSDRGRLKNRTKQYDTINRERISTSAVTPPPTEERSIVLSVSVCVFCLSAIISPKLHIRSSPNFLCLLPMVVARSSSGGVVICYILPVLWITS